MTKCTAWFGGGGDESDSKDCLTEIKTLVYHTHTQSSKHSSLDDMCKAEKAKNIKVPSFIPFLEQLLLQTLN